MNPLSLKNCYIEPSIIDLQDTPISIEHHKKLEKATSYHNKAILCLQYGKYSQATDLSNDAIRIYTKLKKHLFQYQEREYIKQKLSSVFNNLGIISIEMQNYREIQDYRLAIDYLTKAIKLGGTCKSDRLISLGIAFFRSGKTGEGIKQLKQVLEEIKEKKCLDRSVILTYLGQMHYEIKNYKEALFYFQKELEVNEALNGKSSCTNIHRLHHLSDIAKLNQNPEIALKFCQEAIGIALFHFGDTSVPLIPLYSQLIELNILLDFDKATYCQYAVEVLRIHKERLPHQNEEYSLLFKKFSPILHPSFSRKMRNLFEFTYA